MTCIECEKIQEDNRNGKNLAYIRIGKANVLIGACDEHFNLLRIYMGLIPSNSDSKATVNRMNF